MAQASGLLLAVAVGLLVPQDPSPELELRVIVAAGEVEFGTGFPLTVVRRWDAALAAEPWDDAVLAPLTLRLLEATRQERGGTVEETRRYRGFVFRTGTVVVPAPWFRARTADGELRLAFADDLEFEVTSALPPDDRGAMDWPGDVLPAPRRLIDLVVPALVVVTVLGGATWFVRRQRLEAARARAALPPPHVATLARLTALRGATPLGREAVHASFVELSDIVRGYLDARFALGARAATTGELIAAARSRELLEDRQRTRLEQLLVRADEVKFARDVPDADARRRWVDAAIEFVTATADPGTRT